MIDLVTVTQSLRSAIDIAKILKNSTESLDNAETKLQLAELITSLANAKIQIAKIQEALIESDKEKKELEKKLSQKERLFFERPYYLIKQANGDNDGPFCQVCYDKDHKLIRLSHGNYEGVWYCSVCKEDFIDKDYDSEEAQRRQDRALQYMKTFSFF